MLPGGDIELRGHDVHVDAPACEYFPATHNSQGKTSLARPIPNFPSVHAIHEPPFDLINPGLHQQLSMFEVPRGEVKFSGQAIVDVPIFGLYMPSGDRVHFVIFLAKS